MVSNDKKKIALASRLYIIYEAMSGELMFYNINSASNCGIFSSSLLSSSQTRSNIFLYSAPNLDALIAAARSLSYRSSIAELQVLCYDHFDPVSISRRSGHSRVSTTTDCYSHMFKEADDINAETIADIVLRSGRNKAG